MSEDISEARKKSIKKIIDIVRKHGKYEFENGNNKDRGLSSKKDLDDALQGVMQVCVYSITMILFNLYQEKEFNEVANKFSESLISAHNILLKEKE
jgi:hypothetical protein